jgi:hypothetical protein
MIETGENSNPDFTALR